EGGVLYLAMAYVEGADLRELLRHTGRLEPERTLSLIRQVAEALDAAHAAGLVHRDVKPGNILVTQGPEAEQAYVCDFGLARHVTSVSSLTGERGFVGTIDYVPPEQIEGGPIDGRADVYSLGCVLFECLTGERPFERESELSVVFGHLNEPPPKLSAVRPELPQEFDQVFDTALAKSADDRYSTCRELAAAARAALEGKTFVRRKLRRRRLLVVAAALTVAAGVTAGGILATRAGHTPATTSPPPIVLRANALNVVSVRARRVMASIALGSRASQPYADFDLATAGRSAWLLAAGSRQLLRVNLATHRVERKVRLPWAPAGRIAVGGGSVWVAKDGGPDVLGVDAATGRIARRLRVDGANGIGIAYGAGSLWVAQGNDIARIDPDGGRVLRIVVRPGQEGNPNWLTFADGSLWSADAGNGVIRKFDPVANRQVAQITLHGWVSDLAVADGDVWVSVAQDGVLYRLSEDDLSVTGTQPAGLDPERISIGGGNVWVADTGGNAFSGISRVTAERRELRVSARPRTATYSRGMLLAIASAAPRPLPPIRGEEIRIST